MYTLMEPQHFLNNTPTDVTNTKMLSIIFKYSSMGYISIYWINLFADKNIVDKHYKLLRFLCVRCKEYVLKDKTAVEL